MRSDGRMGLLFRLAASASITGLLACGGPARTLPDYSELLHAGVVPTDEAERVVAFLGRAEFELSSRAEVGPVIALGFLRARDGHRAVRVVTPEGVALALDSHAEDGVTPSAGAIQIDEASSGTDLDADGHPDILVVREEPLRRCLLVIEVAEDGAVAPLRVDATDLDPSVCLESLRDVDGDGAPEAIVALYRDVGTARTARAELPLERDEAGLYRRTPPAVAFLSTETSRLDAALVAARNAGDAEECLTLAVERALLFLGAGRNTTAQVQAFDDATASTVWPEGYGERLSEVRRAIAAW